MSRSRAFALTLNLSNTTQQYYSDLIESCELFAKLKGFTIGAIESGIENDYIHCHALLYFVNPIDLNSVISYFKGIHCEIVNNYKRYRDYMKKDGPFFIDTLCNSTQDEDILFDLETIAKNGGAFVEFIRLHPNLISKWKCYETAFHAFRDEV